MQSRCKPRVFSSETNLLLCESFSTRFAARTSKKSRKAGRGGFSRLFTMSLCSGLLGLLFSALAAPSLAADATTVKSKVDLDTDSAGVSDTAGGAQGQSRKNQKSADLPPGKGSGDRDFRSRGPGGPGGPGGPDRRGHHEHDSMFGRGPLDLTALGLTDDQKQKIAQMHADNGIKMRELMKKRRELMGQMRDTMFQADVSEAQIKAKRDEVRQVQERLEDLRLNDFLSIRALLTPEQKLKLKDIKISEGRARDGDGSSGRPPRKPEGDAKRLADTPDK